MQVLAYDAEKTWYSASGPVSATTYQRPHDVELLAATSSSIYVAWVSSTDDSVRQHTFEYAKVTLVVLSLVTVLTAVVSPFPQIDIIGAMVIVWRARGKIIRSVLCSIVCNSCTQ